jgi:hypothetical protein
MMRTYFTKLSGRIIKISASFLIAITLVFAPVSLIQKPASAHAFLGLGDVVVDPTNLVQNTITAIKNVDSSVVTHVLNGIAWSVAKAAIASIQRSTVNWINSGFRGSPAFATDLRENLQNVGDAVANSFFDQLNNSVDVATGFNIRSPFQDQLSSKLRDEYYRQASNGGLNPFTLGQTSGNPTDFLNGDFSQGGFNAWMSASQNPQNNPFGAYLAAQNALFSSINQAESQRKSELDWGKGFLSYRANCPTTLSASTAGSNNAPLSASSLSTRGGSLSSGSAYHAPGTIGASQSANQSLLSNGSVLNGSGASLGASAGSSISLSKADTCFGQKISTPGATIVGQLDHALGATQDTLVTADQINEVLGALANQLVQQVIGPKGLLSASSPSSGGGASVVTQSTASAQNNEQVSSLADGFKQSISGQRQQIVTYQTNQQTILNAANVANTTCSVNASQYPEIQSAIASANAGIAKASTSLNAIDSLTTNITTAQNSPAATRATAITSVISQNQDFLSSSALPTAQDTAQATFDSQDTGTSTPPSLYSKLQQDSRSCSSGLSFKRI